MLFGGASGWECDQRDKGELQPPPTDTTVFLLAQGTNLNNPGAEMTYYDHPGGGFVLSLGSMTVQGALPVDDILSRVVINAINETLS